MTIEDFINKAIDGGWKYKGSTPVFDDKQKAPYVATFIFDGIRFGITTEQILLDPEAWKAVGKVEGWYVGDTELSGQIKDANYEHDWRMSEWQHKMHRMIDALCEGKSLQDYLKSL